MFYNLIFLTLISETELIFKKNNQNFLIKIKKLFNQVNYKLFSINIMDNSFNLATNNAGYMVGWYIKGP